MTGPVQPLLILACAALVTVLLLTKARRGRRRRARELEHAIRPPVALADQLDLDTWCCELAVLTRGQDHETDQPCAEPVIQQLQRPNPGELTAARATTHPNRGITEAEFVAARARSAQARSDRARAHAAPLRDLAARYREDVTMSTTVFPRAFVLHLHHGQPLPGVELPGGRAVVFDDSESGASSGAPSVADLCRGYPGARIEWADEAPAPAAPGLPPQRPCTDPRHTGVLREQLGCVGPDPATT